MKGEVFVEEWFSVSQLSKRTEIPETTTRRYLNNFEEHFRWEQRGRGKKYHPETIEILQRIAYLYGKDYETTEIKSILSNEYAFTVDDNQEDTMSRPRNLDSPMNFEEFRQQQNEFNKQLLKQLQEQLDYIRNILENQNVKSEEIKQLDQPEEKRIDRFNQIMIERKVNRILEKEAMALWQRQPMEQRKKRVGLFRKAEDIDKRDQFIKEYVDERFETYLKREFELEHD